MNVHFLNVGHGDCTIIEHESGRITMVDINNAMSLDDDTENELLQHYYSASQRILFAQLGYNVSQEDLLINAGYDINLTNPVEFLHHQYSGRNIFRFILTHPHMDHMSGLEILDESGIEIVNFWDTDHDIEPDSLSIEEQVSWDEYSSIRYLQDSPKTLRLYRGAANFCYDSDGDYIEILHPTKETHQSILKSGNVNNLSYVLRVNLRGIKIILGGDAEKAVWDDIVEEYGEDLKCHILKASHHGRDSGYHQEAVELMSPDYTIVSVGRKPETDASNKYRQYSSHVWSTRWKGNISLFIDEYGNSNIDSEYDR